MTTTDTHILPHGDLVRPFIAYRKVNTVGLFKHTDSSPLLRALAFSPDGTSLGGAFDQRVVIWRVEQIEDDAVPGGLERWTSSFILCLDDTVEEELSFFAWTKTGFLLIGSTCGSVKVGCFSGMGFQATSHPIKFLALHDRGSFLAVAAGNSELTVWNSTEDGWQYVDALRIPNEALRLSRDREEVTFVGWKESGHENVLVVAYLNHGILSWNIDAMKCTTLLHLDRIWSAALSPDGRHIAVSGKRGSFQIFDLETKIKVSTLMEPEDEPQGGPRTAASPGQFIHEGQYFLGAGQGKANLWNALRSIRAQRLDLSAKFAKSTDLLLAVSDTQLRKLQQRTVRIAAVQQRSRSGDRDLEIPWHTQFNGFLVGVLGRTSGLETKDIVTLSRCIENRLFSTAIFDLGKCLVKSEDDGLHELYGELTREYHPAKGSPQKGIK
ncbi:hypothetical protein NMY22_g15799 [Coprinellus aureogranulatus]|nr:hypothetical protein NMY22_g15799 [Coprinellus aureogranulatus]